MSNPYADIDTESGIIAWFARNPVAANLLMLFIIAAGIMAATDMRRTMQPRLEFNMISISAAYPGAAPEEVERGIIVKIEEAIKDIEAIEKVRSTARESFASIRLELRDDYDVLDVMDEVKSAIDGIPNMPKDAEKVVVDRFQFNDMGIMVQVYGSLDELAMTELVDEIRSELQQNPKIGQITLYGARDYEISIEVTEAQLLKYNLTLEDVARAIRNSSVDLPGGAIKTEHGDIMLRAKGQAYRKNDFERIPLINRPDGTSMTLGEIATITDGFVESSGFSLFNNLYSIGLNIEPVGEQDVLEVAAAAKQYITEKSPHLPAGVYMTSWADVTKYLEMRIDMMLRNLAMGALLVFCVLGLFLQIKLAFWVMVGLPICFLGAFAAIGSPPIGLTLNMMSIFGFILVLGIVVDDAIIIGESTYSAIEEQGHSVDAVIAGAKRVAMPATFGVLTTIVAFVPMLLTGTVFAPFPQSVGWVVIWCLVFSLIESKWILPAHLAHSKPSTEGIFKQLDRLQEFNNFHLRRFIAGIYQPVVRFSIRNRYVVAAAFLSLLILTIGLVAGGRIKVAMMPDMSSPFIKANITMVEGSADWQLIDAYQQVYEALAAAEAEYKAEYGTEESFINHVVAWGNGLNSSLMLELRTDGSSQWNTEDVAKHWREKLPKIPGADVLSISAMEDMGDADMGLRFTGLKSSSEIIAAGQMVQQWLERQEGVFDIRNSASVVRDEIIIELNDSAEALGLTLADVARQVRQAFYGAEAQRIQRGNNEIKVMVRFPREERRAVSDLENMYVSGPQGARIPLSTVARVKLEPGYNTILRVNNERALNVNADIDKNAVEPDKILAAVHSQLVPALAEQFPGIVFEASGQFDDSRKMTEAIFSGFFLAMIAVYALLAIPLGSYTQPMVIMSVVPFGIIGAVMGHMIMGIKLDMMSFMGIIALTGVVVNDSLLMVDFINHAVKSGQSVYSAVIDAGSRRFRAIMLTSWTTFFGLLPMLLEDSLAARMSVSMATSLAFGILFATVITLVFVPCLYVIREDIIKRRLVVPEPDSPALPA